MALIIEDGTGKADAESYATEAQVAAFASTRGLVLTAADAPAREILLRRAMDYLESQESRFAGSRVSSTQALAWPRKEVQLNGFDVGEDTIPPLLVKALCQLAVDADSQDLMPGGDGKEVIKEKIGPLEFTYADTNATAPQPSLTAFWNMIDPLLSSGGGFLLELVHA